MNCLSLALSQSKPQTLGKNPFRPQNRILGVYNVLPLLIARTSEARVTCSSLGDPCVIYCCLYLPVRFKLYINRWRAWVEWVPVSLLLRIIQRAFLSPQAAGAFRSVLLKGRLRHMNDVIDQIVAYIPLLYRVSFYRYIRILELRIHTVLERLH